MPKLKVLFLCTGNSCRSQMAEGWARHLRGDQLEAYSAGLERHGLNPHAIRVMSEAGVDITQQKSKTVGDLGPMQFDYVVTVCGHASEHCPLFPGQTKVVHVGFEDPPTLTQHLPDGEQKLAVYRRVRDEIRRFVETLPEALMTREGEAMNKSKILKELLTGKETLVMPDAYDPISARIIEQAGFKAVQCSGYSFSVAACRKNEIDITMAENLALTEAIVRAVSVPVMADGEDGFGGIEQVAETIEGYVKIGTAGVNLEDQVLDQQPGAHVIDAGLMQEKIRTAKKAAKGAGNADLVINGRTDALKAFASRAEGLQEAIRRGNLYLEAGADLAFVTGVGTLEEVRKLAKEIHGPLSIAAGLFNNLQAFSINDLKELGVARVSLPSIAISATVQALLAAMETLKTGAFNQLSEERRLCTAKDVGRLLGV